MVLEALGVFTKTLFLTEDVCQEYSDVVAPFVIRNIFPNSVRVNIHNE